MLLKVIIGMQDCFKECLRYFRYKSHRYLKIYTLRPPRILKFPLRGSEVFLRYDEYRVVFLRGSLVILIRTYEWGTNNSVLTLRDPWCYNVYTVVVLSMAPFEGAKISL